MKITLELPEDITALLNEDARNLADDIKLMAIIKKSKALYGCIFVVEYKNIIS